MDTDEIIKRIRFFRKKSNLSARELSVKINKNAAYINHIESKRIDVPVLVLFEIIEALGISCAEFFSEDYLNYDRDKELLDIIGVLSPARKELFIELMKNFK